MPRQPRIDIPGNLYHIIIRGIEHCLIFKDQSDYQEFLRRYSELITDCKAVCFAWALMPNHAHLLIRSGQEGIAYFMRRLLTGYAVYFNKRYKRIGHLFQNRYKATLCNHDEYLTILVRYIHLNPLKAKIVNSLDALATYPWTGHSVLLGTMKNSLQDVKSVLELFGNEVKAARENYIQFIKDGINDTGDFEGGGLMRSRGDGSGFILTQKIGDNQQYDAQILGGNDFINNIYASYPNVSMVDQKCTEEVSFEHVMEIIVQRYGLSASTIKGKNRSIRAQNARSELALIGVLHYGMTNTEVAAMLGMTDGGISKIFLRNKKLIQEYKEKSVNKVLMK